MEGEGVLVGQGQHCVQVVRIPLLAGVLHRSFHSSNLRSRADLFHARSMLFTHPSSDANAQLVSMVFAGLGVGRVGSLVLLLCGVMHQNSSNVGL